MTNPPPPPAAMPPGQRKKVAGITCGSLVLFVVLTGIVAAIVSPAKKTAASSPAGAVSTPTAAAVAATTTEATVPSPSAAPTVVPTSAAPKPVTPAKPTPTPKPSPTPTGCGPERDVLVRYITPDLPPSAQLLGNYNLATCDTTFDWLQKTTSTETGYCTQAAWSSDNPGYNPDADPAPPVKKIQVAWGSGC